MFPWWMNQWMNRILVSFCMELHQLRREAWILHVCLQRTMQTKMSLGEFRNRSYKHKRKRQRLCTYSRIYPNSPTLVWTCANSSLLWKHNFKKKDKQTTCVDNSNSTCMQHEHTFSPNYLLPLVAFLFPEIRRISPKWKNSFYSFN